VGRLAALRDRLIDADVDDLLRHDPRLQGVDVTHHADGGVVHVRGQAKDEPQLDHLRTVVRRLRAVLAVWDVVTLPRPDRPVVVDIGCGRVTQFPEAHGLDRRVTPATAAVGDLDRGLPFGTGTVDNLFAVHLLEHVVDPLALLTEIHRVLRPGGVLHVMVPFWRDTIAVADPTHRHLFAPETFQALCDGSAGVPPFRPLIVTRSDDTVFADLQALVAPAGPTAEDLARCFDQPLS
jgi:SAM-dependent methyltransferase